jgi:hypothetical protein
MTLFRFLLTRLFPGRSPRRRGFCAPTLDPTYVKFRGDMREQAAADALRAERLYCSRSEQ